MMGLEPKTKKKKKKKKRDFNGTPPPKTHPMQTRFLPDPPPPSLPTTTPPSTEPASPPHDPHQRMTTTESLSVMINEDEISLVSRYGLEPSDAPTSPPSAPLPNSNHHPQPLLEEIQCYACKSWCDMTSEGIPLDRAQDTSFMDSWCAPFNQFYCPECKATGKAVTLPHYSSPTSEGQNDFVDSDLVIMQSTNLMALLKSMNDGRIDNWVTPRLMMQKIMEIRKSTAAAYASATTKPQPSSPISSITPSSSHSEHVSSPHSNIIPMTNEKFLASVKKKSKGYQRKQINKKPSESKLSQLGSMP